MPDAQTTIKRTNESLIARGYVTWFDCALLLLCVALSVVA